MSGTVALPNRIDAPETGSSDRWYGGQAGPAAIPSTRYFQPPTVPQGRSVGGPRFPRFASIWNLINRTMLQNGTLATDKASGESGAYQREFYPNQGGPRQNNPPTTFNPRTSTNRQNTAPAVPTPAGDKWFAPSEWRQFGVWRQRYWDSDLYGPLAATPPIPNTGFVRGTGQPTFPEYERPNYYRKAYPRLPWQRSEQALFITRRGQIPQMTGPYYPLLTQQSDLSSFGQMTEILPAYNQTQGLFG